LREKDSGTITPGPAGSSGTSGTSGSSGNSASYTFVSGITESVGIVNVKIDDNTLKFSGDTTIYVDTAEFWQSVPLISGTTGTAGDFAYDSDYLYVCISTNAWKRATLNTW
jgi:hypothetical protein